MKITLADEALLGDLLSFLRAHGCIAYVESESATPAVIRPHSFGDAERKEIEALLEQWREAHPRTEPRLADS